MSIETLYAPRTMLAALKNITKPKRFLINMFVSQVQTHTTEAGDIDVVKGGRKLAPFVSPRVEGKVIERNGYATHTYKPPYIKPKRITTAHHALVRLPGEMLYDSGMGPNERAMEILQNDFTDLEDQISRREEWMAAQLLQTGKVVCVGDGINETVDFLMGSSWKPVLASTAKWNAVSTATPIDDFTTGKGIGLKAGKNMNVAIMNQATLGYLLGNTKQVIGASSVFDKTKITLGTIQPEQLEPGVSYVGRIAGIGLDIYTYDEYYEEDNNGSARLFPMIADGKVIMGSTLARTTMHYGVIQDLEAGTLAVAARFPKTWIEKDPSARILMLQSAPLPALHEIEAFLCATVY